MPRTLTIELPLPARELSPNGRFHWRPKADAVRQARHTAKMQAWKAKADAKLEVPLLSPVTLTAEFYLCRPGPFSYLWYFPRDEQNAIGALKAQVDGIADACLIVSDAAKHLKIGGVKLYSTAKEHKGRSCVVLTLTEAEAA